MRDASPVRTMTVEEYFRFEEESPVKHEYVAGEVYAMSGATARHNMIAGNIFTRLFTVAAESPCRVFMSDMRLEAANDKYYYPDVAVVCTPVDDLDIVAREPCVVVEVTSPGTARIDRSEKLEVYRAIQSLRTYLIVDHRRRRVERHWRADATVPWSREEVVGDGSVGVPCLEVELPLDTIYRRVDLASIAEPDAAEYEA